MEKQQDVERASNNVPVGVTDLPAANLLQKVDNIVDQKSSTAFQDDGQIVTKVTRSILNSSGPTPFDSNEVADFLGKPVIVASGSISTADVKASTIASFSIAQALESQQIWYRKLAGYNLIRATAVVKLVVNANPFQAGRLILTFLPCYRHLTSGEQAARGVDSAQDTIQPNVELDIIDSSAEMDIPYITPTYYYNRQYKWYDWGTVFLKILSPLRVGSGGETEFEYTLFLSFKDVELAAPIYGPESSLKRTGPVSTSRVSRTNMRLYKESQSTSAGVVESTAMKVAAVSEKLKSSIFSRIPVVGSFVSSGTEVIKGVSDTVASIASIFGWSKPISQEAQVSVFQQPYKYGQNCDGVMPSDVPSITANPLLVPKQELFGTSVDEMSFAYLRKIPSQIAEFDWSTTAVQGTALYTMDLDPAGLVRTGTKTVGDYTTTFRTGSPLFILSHFFNQCRGGVEITFKFAKTNFHSGRIAIVYEPKLGSTPTLAQSPYLLREIVDLRSANTITMKIPYLFGAAYRSTGFGAFATSPDGLVDESLGTLRVIVLNELRCPETTTNTIQVLVYANPADDYEIAVPISVPFAGFTAESALSSVMNTKLDEKGIGNSTIDVDPSQYLMCTSDPIVSMKQLFTCSRRFYSTDDALSNTQSIYIYPSGAAVATETGFTTLEAVGLWGDYMSFLPLCYAFHRGGFRITHQSTRASGTVHAFISQTEENTPTVSSNLSGMRFSASQHSKTPLDSVWNGFCPVVSRIQTSGSVDFIMPYYGKTPIRLTRMQTVSGPYALPNPHPPDTAMFNLCVYSTDNTGLTPGTWQRSAADDYCAGYFIGFPPLAVNRTFNG